MDISVIIPTYHRPEKIARCVERLMHQTHPADACEVLIGIDNGLHEPEQTRLLTHALRTRWPDAHQDRLTILPCNKIGLSAVRNELLPHAQGEILLSLNDDVLPEPELLSEHVRAHAQASQNDQPVVVSGSSPWIIHHPDRAFDLLLRQSSMVFFEPQMNAALASGDATPDHDWGFRHACGLNFSVPMHCVHTVGNFSVYPVTYGYEDTEYVYRLATRFNSPVLYRPKALAPHDHRMDPADYLNREYTLGTAAWGFAMHSPQCARATFGRDITTPEEILYSREFVAREASTANAIRETFLGLADIPREALPPDGHPALEMILRSLYEHHLLLKRWQWRRGLLDGAQAHAPQAGPLSQPNTHADDRVTAQTQPR